MEINTIITIIWIFWILGFLIFDKFFNKNEKNILEDSKNSELENKISELEWERRILSEENIRTKIELDKKNENFWEKFGWIIQRLTFFTFWHLSGKTRLKF